MVTCMVTRMVTGGNAFYKSARDTKDEIDKSE